MKPFDPANWRARWCALPGRVLAASLMAGHVLAASLPASLPTSLPTSLATTGSPAGAPPVASVRYERLPGASFRTVLPPDGKNAPAKIAPFALRSHLVSNAEFLRFVQLNPNWQRGQVPALFADADYLSGWAGPLDIGKLAAEAPVTRVSWFAAQAFCASEQARLPRFAEWEYAAAADATRLDARTDPKWLASILEWYSHPANQPPGPVGQCPANAFRLYDIHNLVWEWVEDFNGLFVSSDSRQAAEAKQLEYCGGAALSLSDKQNYAILIRLALLAAMEAPKSGPLLGFRCARDLPNGE